MESRSLLGNRIGGVRVVPLTLKIVAVFVVFLLTSNFATNYINLTLNRGELVKLMNELLVKELKEIYTFASNQYDIFQFSGDVSGAKEAMAANAGRELKRENSLALAVSPGGNFFFKSGKHVEFEVFPDKGALASMEASRAADAAEGPLFFKIAGAEFFGVYKYNEKWDVFLIRAEKRAEFYSQTDLIFMEVALLILALSIVFVAIGIVVLRHILRFVPRITAALMRMQTEQQLQLIDLSDAPNDDVTYLGASFNSLSSSIDNLMTIFRTFVSQDIVNRAYSEHEIKLEGDPRDLTILFTDIKGFTYMTETLGNDIIALLNMHYDRAIRHIHARKGIVGSIIGDALLAVFGTMSTEDGASKSVDALLSAYDIQEVAKALRDAMRQTRDEIIAKRGQLSAAEEKVFKAVLLEVGVGIDGGEVFYGNIGSSERMTNTVIGDNVNSSSRLEGLTRVYKVPIICSEYVVNEVLGVMDRYFFVELDTVQVKGKTEGKKVFYPLDKKNTTVEDMERFAAYSRALRAYYEGRWDEARAGFGKCELPAAAVFLSRLENREPPADWNGVWTMESK
jgi:class 3 adenylate cyclase